MTNQANNNYVPCNFYMVHEISLDGINYFNSSPKGSALDTGGTAITVEAKNTTDSSKLASQNNFNKWLVSKLIDKVMRGELNNGDRFILSSGKETLSDKKTVIHTRTVIIVMNLPEIPVENTVNLDEISL